MSGEATRFLNVDLELVTTGEVDALLGHWGALVMLRDSVDDGKRTIWIELAEELPDAESTLGGFLALVEALPVALRMVWDDCEDRCFNVGIQAGATPHSAAFRMAPNTLRRIANSNSRVEVTVYGASEGSENH